MSTKDKNMINYIDSFVFPIPRIYIEEYKQAAEKVAEIWKEYGAIAYFEFVGDDLSLEGTKSFIRVRTSSHLDHNRISAGHYRYSRYVTSN